MMKIAIVGSMFLAVALSSYVPNFDDDLNEYELQDVQPMHTISLPYPYQGNRNQHHGVPAVPIYTHSNVIVPTTEVEVSSHGLVYTAISFALQAAKTAIVVLLSNAPALVAGTVVALGVCKLTSLCGTELTIIEAQRELRSIATPERITSVTNFVKEAIRRYREMQV